jgi:hypothetical protein
VIVTCHVDPQQMRLQLRSLERYRIGQLRVLVPSEEDVEWAEDELAWASPLPYLAEIDTCWYGEVFDGVPPALRTYLTCDEPLGYKVLLPLRMRGPHLWMDGDVILTRDPARHTGVHYPWASRSGLDDWTKVGSLRNGDARTSRLALEVAGEFTTAPDSRHRTDAAVWWMPRPVDRGAYLDVLQRFFTLPSVVADAEAGGNRRRTLDQKFLSTWLVKKLAQFTGGRRSDPDPLADCYRAAASWKAEEGRRDLGKATFLHYCCSGQKDRAIEKYEGLLP